MLKYKSIFEYPRGTLESLLIEAYESFHREHPEYENENFEKFEQCDSFFYDNPPIGENCSLICEYHGEVAGMSCWDPREKPTVVIGHNCIRPKFRGKGLGTMQMKEILCRFRSKGFTAVKVSTGIMDFFVPAQKMYEAAGFSEVRRDEPGTSSDLLHKQVYYEMLLG